MRIKWLTVVGTLVLALIGQLLMLSVVMAGSSTMTGQDGAPMVLVPEGEFTMGARDDNSKAEDDEKPKHDVKLDAFYIDKFEVTTKRYQAFMNDSGRGEPKWWSQTIPVSQAEKPVVGVTWDDAKAYCDHYKKRLPTEAEWEKAARGTDGRLYLWGNDRPTTRHANFDNCCDFKKYGVLTNVGSREAGKSPYGAYDMAGNVWEWVADWYDKTYYKIRQEKNPKGPKEGSNKVLRGGSWFNAAWRLRSSNRYFRNPTVRLFNVGFRCARDAP